MPRAKAQSIAAGVVVPDSCIAQTRLVEVGPSNGAIVQASELAQFSTETYGRAVPKVACPGPFCSNRVDESDGAGLTTTRGSGAAGETYRQAQASPLQGQKTALVLGAGGFIGSHLARRLRSDGFWVRGVDLKWPEFSHTAAHDFRVGDLRDPAVCRDVFDVRFEHVYQLAADMGGAGYIFSGNNDAHVMHNSATINLNVVDLAQQRGVSRVFYSSSACIYPAYNQVDPNNPKCSEDSAYPAAPDSEYGWEKLFSERLYLAYLRNYNLEVRIARLHNIFGPEGTWQGGREKAPAAMCRKVAEAADDGTIEIWGDGLQTRSFLYVDACVEGIRRLMESDVREPVNIGSEEMVTINQLAAMTAEIAGKRVHFKHISGPLGVRGRNSDNHLVRKLLGWEPTYALREGMAKTYAWIASQVAAARP